jgi:hypothetical protein
MDVRSRASFFVFAATHSKKKLDFFSKFLLFLFPSRCALGTLFVSSILLAGRFEKRSFEVLQKGFQKSSYKSEQ